MVPQVRRYLCTCCWGGRAADCAPPRHCRQGELLAACVEGFLLRNMKYYPKGTADAICSQWNPNWKSYTAEMCRGAAALTQYSFDRPVERYVVQA